MNIIKNKINILIISDSSGATAFTIAKTAASQFAKIETDYKRYPFIQTKSILKGILKLALETNAMVFHTLVNPELSKYVYDFCKQNNLYEFDCIQKPLYLISQKMHIKPEIVPGMVHDLNDQYFNRISAIEFAVTNDDGKNPSGLLQADIVVLGISRTSKTPLSLYLANQNIKVANLPIGPGIQLPDEIWKVDTNKIIGLTNTITNLKKIRKERVLAYGLNPDTPYSSSEYIEKEINYANDLYKKLNCIKINVHNKSIEETATVITESLNLNTD